MTLPEFLRSHLAITLSPVPFTADELAYVATSGIGRKVTTAEVALAMG